MYQILATAHDLLERLEQSELSFEDQITASEVVLQMLKNSRYGVMVKTSVLAESNEDASPFRHTQNTPE